MIMSKTVKITGDRTFALHANIKIDDSRRKDGEIWRMEHLSKIRRDIRDSLRQPKMESNELLEAMRMASRTKVQCPICGKFDNDWKPRGGLCLDCFCREMNLYFKEQSDSKK